MLQLRSTLCKTSRNECERSRRAHADCYGLMRFICKTVSDGGVELQYIITVESHPSDTQHLLGYVYASGYCTVRPSIDDGIQRYLPADRTAATGWRNTNTDCCVEGVSPVLEVPCLGIRCCFRPTNQKGDNKGVQAIEPLRLYPGFYIAGVGPR